MHVAPIHGFLSCASSPPPSTAARGQTNGGGERGGDAAADGGDGRGTRGGVNSGPVSFPHPTHPTRLVQHSDARAVCASEIARWSHRSDTEAVSGRNGTGRTERRPARAASAVADRCSGVEERRSSSSRHIALAPAITSMLQSHRHLQMADRQRGSTHSHSHSRSQPNRDGRNGRLTNSTAVRASEWRRGGGREEWRGSSEHMDWLDDGAIECVARERPL